MTSALNPAIAEAPPVSRLWYDGVALAVLLAFALAWPAYAAPYFWFSSFAQRDIIGIDSIVYFTGVMNDISGMAYERRPLFGSVMAAVKWTYAVLFRLDSADATWAAFRTMGVLPPLLTYLLARFHLDIRASFAVAAFCATTLVVMFNQLAYDSYALTMAAGVGALIAAAAYHRWLPDPVTRRPMLAALAVIVVTLASGWIALTLLSVLLLFLVPAFAKAPRARRTIIWAGLVCGMTGIVFVIPSLAKSWVTDVQGAMVTRYFLPQNLLSIDAWANRLTADFVAALAYPGEILSGSRYIGITGTEDWMAPVRKQALADPWALLLGGVFLGLMAMAWKPVRRGGDFGYQVLAIWLALAVSIVFFVMWSPGEAMLFSGCIWPFQMALAIVGRAQIGPQRGWIADLALVGLAVLMFLNNFDVLIDTAANYD